MVICPGGGYMKLCMDYEGYDAARWFAANGVTAAVLKYRLPEGHPEVPLEDAVQALRIMAGLEAGATATPADRVGIAGFSAGGHLAAAVSTLGTFKPAFSILFYPVTGDGESPAAGITFDRLLGGPAHGCRRRGGLVAVAAGHRRNPSRAAVPLRRRRDRPALKQHGLLRRPETVRHRGLAAHLPLGRTRAGACSAPSPTGRHGSAPYSTGSTASAPSRTGSAAAEKRHGALPFAEYCLSLRK